MPRLVSRYGDLNPQLQSIRKLATQKPRAFIEKNVKISDRMGNVVDFKFNWAQRKYYEIKKDIHKTGKPLRLWLVKWRRAGITSAESALGFTHCWSHDNARLGIIAHQEDRAAEILQNYNFYYESMIPQLQIQKSKDNIFGIKFERTYGQALIATSKNAIKVRGDGIHRLHGSEAAHYGWDFKNVAEEVCPVVPALPGSEIVYESTGSTRGCQAHLHAQAAKNNENEFTYRFLCWLEDPECDQWKGTDKDLFDLMEKIGSYEPRLTELIRYYKLTPGQSAKAWEFYHFGSNNDFDYFCREFPVCEEFALSAGGSSFFGQLEINKAQPQRPQQIYVFQGGYIGNLFTLAELTRVEEINDYSPFTNIKVWAPPSRNGKYAIGADIALGTQYGDYSAGYVVDIATREMMASFHGRIQPTESAHVLVSLAKMYNNAILAPECNPGGGGLITMNDIRRIGYYNLYIFRKRDSIEGLKASNWAGWWTTGNTRPMMLGELRKVFVDTVIGRLPYEHIFRDVSVINEMRTFVPDPNTSIPKALRGCYDDRVMALAITHQVAADESYCTKDDLIHSYHKREVAQRINQELLVQRIKPTDVMDKMMGTSHKWNLPNDYEGSA